MCVAFKQHNKNIHAYLMGGSLLAVLAACVLIVSAVDVADDAVPFCVEVSVSIAEPRCASVFAADAVAGVAVVCCPEPSPLALSVLSVDAAAAVVAVDLAGVCAVAVRGVLGVTAVAVVALAGVLPPVCVHACLRMYVYVCANLKW